MLQSSSGLFFIAAAFVGCLIAMAPGCASASSHSASAATTAVNTVLDDFHDAASKADYNRYFSYWTDESVFLGTDATERWVGNQFKSFAKPYFDQGKGWAYTPRNRVVTVAPDGLSAFFDELLANDKLGTCRGSGVVRSTPTGWRILQYNLSIPIPNDLAESTAQQIKALEASAAKPAR